MTNNGQAQSSRQVPKKNRGAPVEKSKAKYSASGARFRATPFDYTFRATHLPHLKLAAHRLAWAIPHGLGFSEAHNTLVAIALERGAAQLSDLDSLIDFLSHYLAQAASAGNRIPPA